MTSGESEANLRRLFAKAVATKPSIIFFDEIDGLCPNRERSANICHAYVGVVTAMLGLIDSVKRGDVLIIGATNRVSISLLEQSHLVIFTKPYIFNIFKAC